MFSCEASVEDQDQDEDEDQDQDQDPAESPFMSLLCLIFDASTGYLFSCQFSRVCHRIGMLGYGITFMSTLVHEVKRSRAQG